MKIAVYAISKNEEQFVERFCQSAKEADIILIADTGSTDNTVTKAIQCGAQVYDICISPWRFDRARDASLALLPRDVDVCIALDLDEVLEPGWRQEIEKLWVDGVNRLGYRYDWGSGKVFFSTKIHARHGFTWKHPCHEYIKPDPRITEKYAWTDKLLISHYPDKDKSRGQYMDLLEMSVKEDPSCPRNAFYYARELTYYKRWEEAIQELNRYLSLPTADWKNERAFALRLIGDAHEALGKDGLEWYRKGCAEDPEVRESWLALAEATSKKQMWAESYGAAKTALEIKEPTGVYTNDPSSFTSKPYDLAAIAAYYLGLKEEAKKLGELALEMEPTDERLIKNMEYYKG